MCEECLVETIFEQSYLVYECTNKNDEVPTYLKACEDLMCTEIEYKINSVQKL